MVKHELIKQRIDDEASKLKEFTTARLCDRLNHYIGYNGNRTKRRISSGRLANFLQANKKVKFIPHRTSSTKTGSWKWIGDEEE